MQIIAHRGASGYKPENTLSSFQEAISHGVDMIEFDVFAIRSGEVVVHHDTTVNRTTNGVGNISDYTWEELRQLDAGGGQRIPLLTEVLDLIDNRIPVNIELKGSHIAEPVAAIINQYVSKQRWQSQRFLVSAFDHAELRRFAALSPSVPVGALYRSRPRRLRKLMESGNFTSAHFDAKFITRKSILNAHTRGLKVYAYTVNSRRSANRMRALKVDGVFTNYPDLLVK